MRTTGGGSSSGGAAGGVNRLPGRIEHATFRGAQTQVILGLPGCTLVADVANLHGEVPDWLREGRQVWACIAPDAIRVLPATDATAPTDVDASSTELSGG